MNKKQTIWTCISIAIVVVLAVSALILTNKFHIDLTVNGKDITIEYGSSYTDEGAEAVLKGNWFMKSGTPAKITVDNEVNTSKTGKYTVTYTAKKWFWKAVETRTVNVVDTQAPVITLIGADKVEVSLGHEYQDGGCSATDNYDGDLTAKVTATDNVDSTKLGTYEVVYTVKDSSGNTATSKRIVIVKLREGDDSSPFLK